MDNLNIDNDIIENEIGNESVGIDVPFDPNQINVISPPMNVGDIIDRLENGEIMLDTEFQRLPDLWGDVKKSRFIESLLLKLPIPKFYFDGQDDNKWRVIDGLQRISTFRTFIKDKTMRLQGLEFLKEYENKAFDELPRELQRRLKTSSVSVHILEKGTPDVVKFLLFSRINQGSLLLTPQEIRHAMHQGKASDLIKELVDKNNEIGQSFIKVTEGKISTKRMEDRDFAARFVAFYLLSYENYKPDMDSFINAGMTAINKSSGNEIKRLKVDFQKAMETAHAIFGNDAFRRRDDISEQRKPINKALFEVLSVNLAKCSDTERESLIKQKYFLKNELLYLNATTRFRQSITQSTALKENVEYRFKIIYVIIKKTLDFQKGVEAANIILENTIFTISGNTAYTKSSKILEKLSNILAECTDEERDLLIKYKEKIVENLIQLPLKPLSIFDLPQSQVLSKSKRKKEFNIPDLNRNKSKGDIEDIQHIIKTTLENA